MWSRKSNDSFDAFGAFGSKKDRSKRYPSLSSSPVYSSSLVAQAKNKEPGTWNGSTSLSSSSHVSLYQKQGFPTPQFMSPVVKTLEKIGVKSPSVPSASQVAFRLNKVVTYEKRTLEQQEQYCASIANWINGLQNPKNCRLLVEFNHLAELQIRTQEELIRRQENMNLQLNHVSQREQKLREQRLKRSNTVIGLRNDERKKGEGQSIHLAKEKMEELDASIKVISRQLDDAVENSVKGAFVDYVICLQSTCAQIQDACNDFFQFINSEQIHEDEKAQIGKIESLDTSRSASENKENQLKERVADHNNNLNSLNFGLNLKGAVSNKDCDECHARLGKDGKLTHLSFCSLCRPSDRPYSQQSLAKPEAESMRLAAGAAREGPSIWQC